MPAACLLSFTCAIGAFATGRGKGILGGGAITDSCARVDVNRRIARTGAVIVFSVEEAVL
jgi:hypothetical protein